MGHYQFGLESLGTGFGVLKPENKRLVKHKINLWQQ